MNIRNRPYHKPFLGTLDLKFKAISYFYYIRKKNKTFKFSQGFQFVEFGTQLKRYQRQATGTHFNNKITIDLGYIYIQTNEFKNTLYITNLFSFSHPNQKIFLKYFLQTITCNLIHPFCEIISNKSASNLTSNSQYLKKTQRIEKFMKNNIQTIQSIKFLIQPSSKHLTIDKIHCTTNLKQKKIYPKILYEFTPYLNIREHQKVQINNKVSNQITLNSYSGNSICPRANYKNEFDQRNKTNIRKKNIIFNFTIHPASVIDNFKCQNPFINSKIFESANSPFKLKSEKITFKTFSKTQNNIYIRIKEMNPDYQNKTPGPISKIGLIKIKLLKLKAYSKSIFKNKNKNNLANSESPHKLNIIPATKRLQNIQNTLVIKKQIRKIFKQIIAKLTHPHQKKIY